MPEIVPLKFDLSKKYLVYGFEPPENSRIKIISDKSFGTYRCFRTQSVDQASDDLKFLRNLPAKDVGGKIFGKIYRTEWNENRDFEEIAFVNIPVTIKETESNLLERILRTNKSGEFEIKVPVGFYEVKANLPEGFKLSNDYQKPFGIRNAGCANKSFILEKEK